MKGLRTELGVRFVDREAEAEKVIAELDRTIFSCFINVLYSLSLAVNVNEKSV
jgi:hypothetical protein